MKKITSQLQANMETNILKYRGLTFPVFALQNKPRSISYSLDKITIIPHREQDILTLDDKSLQGEYLQRLFQKNGRLTFDYTCTTLQDLIFCKAAWGIDSKGIPHDFSTKYTTKIDQRPVERVRDNLFWVKGISYPFKINTREKIDLSDQIFATIN